ncbi:hypothetical protein ACROYT_G010559 [Oculina patagonica]
MSKTVAIIGTGASGLAAIKSCLEVGLEPTAFETDPSLGGIWRYTNLNEEKDRRSCVPYSTISNTSKHFTCFSDFPMPKEWPNYLPQQQFLEYFQLYAKKFGLEKRIRFETTVHAVEPVSGFSQTAETGRWRVQYRDKNNKEQMEEFDFVMVCSGVNWDPNVANIPGLDGFPGEVIHSKEYRTWKNFEGKRVLVVGLGNSAGDIACELSRHTRQVYLSTRSGSWVMSRLVDRGAPLDVTFVNRFLDVIPTTVRNQFFRHKLESTLNLVNFGLGVAEPPYKRWPVINDELPHRIITGSIQVKADIAEVQGSTVLFTDGSKEVNIDAIILAIGFKFSFPILSDSLLCPTDRYIPLYKYVFPPACNPGTLAVIGALRVNGPVPPLCEVQARWAASVFAGKTKLPDCQTMVEEIEKTQQQLEANTVRCCRAFHLVQFIKYLDEISSLFGAKPNLWHLLMTDPVLAFKCFFGPCVPAQYRLMGPGSWQGARDVIMEVKESVVCPLRTRKAGQKENKEKPGWQNLHLLFVLGLLVVAILFLFVKAI